MVPNVTLKTLSFNQFIVIDDMNDSNQGPDLNFFYESVSSSLDTDYVSPKNFRSKFKNYTEKSFCFTSKY